MALLTMQAAETVLLAFTSCRRFQGSIRFYTGQISVVLEAEGISLLPGETWRLDDFIFAVGADRNPLLEALVEAIHIQHKPRISASPPVGWSSWVSFGHEVTAAQVTRVVDTLRTIPAPTRIIQVDDGYQEHMGDWLVTPAWKSLSSCQRLAGRRNSADYTLAVPENATVFACTTSEICC